MTMKDTLQNLFKEIDTQLVKEPDTCIGMIYLIRKERRTKGWTRRDLAARSGVSFLNIDRIEVGWYSTSRTMHLGRLLLRVMGARGYTGKTNRRRMEYKARRYAYSKAFRHTLDVLEGRTLITIPEEALQKAASQTVPYTPKFRYVEHDGWTEAIPIEEHNAK